MFPLNSLFLLLIVSLILSLGLDPDSLVPVSMGAWRSQGHIPPS